MAVSSGTLQQIEAVDMDFWRWRAVLLKSGHPSTFFF